MMSIKAWHLCLLFVLTAVVPIEGRWDYYENGPLVWGQVYSSCNGNEQSPMSIAGSIEDASKDIFTFHDYHTVLSGPLIYNGHEVFMEFEVKHHATHPRFEMTSSFVSGLFYLDRMFIRYPGEHSTKGEEPVLEIQLLYQDPETDQILIVAHPYIDCGTNTTTGKTHPFPWQIAEGVRNLSKAGISNFPEVSLDDISNTEYCDFYGYMGSLTQPPCPEGIMWMVQHHARCAYPSEIEAFQQLQDPEGRPHKNSRPPQPRNGRVVEHFWCS